MMGAQTREERTTLVPSSSLNSLANAVLVEVIFCRIKNNKMVAMCNILLALSLIALSDEESLCSAMQNVVLRSEVTLRIDMSTFTIM
jgi:hypothetical protein